MEELGDEKTKFSDVSSFFSKFKFVGSKIKIAITVCLVVIILLIFLSSFNGTKSTDNVETEISSSWVEYCNAQENRLEYVLGQIKGIKNVNVFLMIDSSPTIKYLEETKTESTVKEQTQTESKETTIVLSKNGSISTPVVVVENLPQITGVLVVANGAGDIKIKNTLINTVSAILNVKVSCVEVLEGK